MAELDLSFEFMGARAVRETEHWVSQLSSYNNQELRIIKSLDPVTSKEKPVWVRGGR